MNLDDFAIKILVVRHMRGFEHYHTIIDLANNPNYDFLSYNIDPKIIIYSNGFKNTIENIYDYECFPCVGESSKRDKNTIHFFVSQSLVILSAGAIFYMLFGLIRFFGFSGIEFNDKLLWFIIFGFAFLVPLLMAFYKLFSNIVRINKYYNEMSYQTFALSYRMFSENRIASSYEISDAIDELTYYFEKTYLHFDNGKQIKRFFEKRYQKIPLTYYNDIKKQSSIHLIHNQHRSSTLEIVVELLIGVLGTVFNVIKDFNIIVPALHQIIAFLIISIVLIVSIAYLAYCVEVYKMRNVFCYYYIYSYLFLESSTNKNVKTEYLFNFAPNSEDGSLSVFENHIYELIKTNRIPAFKKDVEIIYNERATTVIIYGVEQYDYSLKQMTELKSFDDFFVMIGGKKST